jgi:hypothetical protein
MSNYVTLIQANDYFENNRPDADEWANSEESLRRKYLNCAEDIIVLNAFQFPQGFLQTENQEGRNYRIFRRAIFEEAIYLMQTKALQLNEKLMMGIQSASAGPLSVTFSKEFDKPLIPPSIQAMLESIGAVSVTSNTITTGPILF